MTDRLDEILAEFGRKCSPVATLRNVDNPLVRREYIDEATQAINQLIKDEVIKELERLTKIDAFNESYTPDPRPARLVRIRIKELQNG